MPDTTTTKTTRYYLAPGYVVPAEESENDTPQKSTVSWFIRSHWNYGATNTDFFDTEEAAMRHTLSYTGHPPWKVMVGYRDNGTGDEVVKSVTQYRIDSC